MSNITILQDECGYPPEITTILSKIQELTLGKIFNHYKLDGAAFDRIKKLTNVISDNLIEENDENEDHDENSDSDNNCDSE